MATGLDVTKLHAIVERERQRFNVPGVEVAIVQEGEVLFAGGFGVRSAATGLPVTSKTVFAHASTGKAATAFLIGQLVDDGLVNWDEPVRTYLPDFRMHDPVATERATLRDFLCHRSGVAAHDLAWLPYPNASRADLVDRMRHFPPSRDFRTVFQYCNWGYVLAGYVAGIVSGSTWEEQMRRRIFEPLGLRNTYLDTAAVMAVEDHAEPHHRIDGEPQPIAYRESANVAPAGGILSCADDVARWLMVQLNGGHIDGMRLISQESLRETQRVQFPVVASDAALEASHLVVYGYGMGWGVYTYRGRRFLTHSGGIEGFTTEFDLLPDQKIGIAVSNNIMSPLPTVVARHIIDMLLGEEPQDWGKEARDASEQAVAMQREQTTNAKPSHPLADFAGGYEHPGYGALQVDVDGDRLSLKLGALEFAAAHRHYDTWDLTWPAFPDMKFWITFVTDERGKITEARTNFEIGSGEVVAFTR